MHKMFLFLLLVMLDYHSLVIINMLCLNISSVGNHILWLLRYNYLIGFELSASLFMNHAGFLITRWSC